ncbi:hypothetical protein GGR56DRAFT_245696 [Xylariaceae sp. FL0804]|nr:hypothetical protein GGR56DRAFT_245696 [Xylariaceae sp. FL0804]
MSLLSLMAYNGNNHVKEPVGRIYGVGAMTNRIDREIIEKLERYVGVRATYTALDKEWVPTHDKLDIICYASLYAVYCDDPEKRDLLSWVPDWTEPTNTFGIAFIVRQGDHFGPVTAIKGSQRTLNRFRASGDFRPRANVSDESLQLACTVITVDYVDGLGALDGSDHFLVQSACADDAGPPSATSRTELLNKVVRSLVLDRRDKYLHKPAPVDQYREELLDIVAGQAVSGSHSD